VKRLSVRSIQKEIVSEKYIVLIVLYAKVAGMILDVKLIHTTTEKQRSGKWIKGDLK
jgi:hypothetical protein